MLLSSLPTAVLGLIVAFSHPVVAVHTHTSSGSAENKVNYYSDLKCNEYQGSLPGPHSVLSTTAGYVISLDNSFIGSVLYLTVKNPTFNLLSASGPDVARAMVPGKPDLTDKNFNDCYTINNNVTAITLYNIDFPQS
jgi:hypothetical protein